MKTVLNAGDTFPELPLSIVGGDALRFPVAPDARYRIVLFYRGHW